MINVAYVLPDFRGGGAEKVMVRLANELVNYDNYNVYIFVSNINGPNIKFVSQNINVISLGAYGVKSLFRLIYNVIKYDIDLVIGTLNMAHVVSLSKPFLPRKTIVVARLGNTISLELKEKSGGSKLIYKLYQYTLLLSDNIVFQSLSMKNDYKKVLNLDKIKKSKVIYNPISEKEIYELSKECTFDLGDNDIVTVGRLEKQKNHKLTIDAFKYYISEYRDATLHIIGTGSLYEPLKEYVDINGLSNNIIFHGYIENPYTLIKNARVLVMSSLYEGFSNVLLEAITLKTPVVVSDCPGGNSEIVKDGINGYLFDTNSSVDMYDKIILARKIVIESNNIDKYRIENITNNYLSLLNE